MKNLPTVTARTESTDERYGSEIVALSTGHRIQFGGVNGDGYCYARGGTHGFECLDNLTADERRALRERE